MFRGNMLRKILCVYMTFMVVTLHNGVALGQSLSSAQKENLTGTLAVHLNRDLKISDSRISSSKSKAQLPEDWINELRDDSILIGKPLYKKIKKWFKSKMIQDLTLALEKDLKLLSPQWIVGQLSSRDLPVREGEAFAFFLKKLGFNVKIKGSATAPYSFARGDFTLLAGKKIENGLSSEDLGNGGMVIGNDKRRFVLISDAVSLSDRLKYTQEMKGIMDVYTLPKPRLYYTADAYGSDIDDHIGFINRLNLMVLDPGYYRTNKFLVDKIAKKHGYVDAQGKPKIALAAEEEIEFLPPNLVNLDDGRALMSYAPKTFENIAKAAKMDINQLSDYLIIDKEMNFKFSTHELRGGPLCLCNRDYPLMNFLKQQGWSKEEIAAIIMVNEYQDKFWFVVENKKIALNERAIDFAVNELLLRWTLWGEVTKDVQVQRLSEIQKNFLKKNQRKAAERIQEFLTENSETEKEIHLLKAA